MIFTHTPRSPEVPDKHPTQHWFFQAEFGLGGRRLSSTNSDGHYLQLMRHTVYCSDLAALEFVMPAGGVTIHLTAAELLELARMCVDAAADIGKLS